MQSRILFLAKAIEKSREEYKKGQYVTLEDLRRGKVRKIKRSSILKLAGKYNGKKSTMLISLTRVRDFVDYFRW